MNKYTFKNGDFVITIHRKNLSQAHDALSGLLRIIEGQIGFDSMPNAWEFEVINIEETVE